MMYYLYNWIHLPNPDSWLWFQSLVWSTWFPSPYSSCLCDSWEEGHHYIRLPSKPTLMKASWLQHRWQMPGGQPVMLIFVYAILQVIIKVRRKIRERVRGVRRWVRSLRDSLSWLKASGWLSVVYVLLWHRQASMLISSHSCCYTRSEEASPQWFMSCQGRGFASCLTSERVPLPWKGHIWAILSTWVQSSWQDGILLWSHFHS